ncbi:MAG: ECF transporter S component [Coriobacteriales bacterium]
MPDEPLKKNGRRHKGKSSGEEKSKGALGALGLSVGESSENKAGQVDEIETAAQMEHDRRAEQVVAADAVVAEAESAESEEESAKSEATAASTSAEPEAASAQPEAESASKSVAASAEPAASKKPEKPKRKKFTKRTVVSIFIIVIAIPVTIALGLMFGDRNYYITSVLIIIYTLIPFFLVFEHRKPQARELVIIAVMTAIAVVSRVIFIWFPGFSPLIGIVIITGMSLGAESGFLTGALAAFVSNFIFGQGPWTPWQMFAYGIGGFIAGLLYRKGILSKKRLPLCIYGGVIVMCFIGPLLDTCTLFMAQSVITWEAAATIYLAGIPYNAIHATAVVLTLAFAANPLFEKLDRVKTKYGMMED